LIQYGTILPLNLYGAVVTQN